MSDSIKYSNDGFFFNEKDSCIDFSSDNTFKFKAAGPVPFNLFGDDIITFDSKSPDDLDMVNHPPHYTSGQFEAIDVIEDAIAKAPSTKAAMLQGQVLKYLLRLWSKGNSRQDAEKAQWYLTRLIDSL